MDVTFIKKRITDLRSERNVSARDMSLSLGLNGSYINNIESGKAYPSMSVFFDILEYFGVTPEQFFDAENIYPVYLGEVVGDLKKLNHSQLVHVSEIVKDIIGRK